MNNLKFYERAIELRKRYESEMDTDKILILNQIITVAFQFHEELPVNFNFSLPSAKYHLSFNLKVAEVLADIDSRKSVVHHYGDSKVTDFTMFFVKQVNE